MKSCGESYLPSSWMSITAGATGAAGALPPAPRPVIRFRKFPTPAFAPRGAAAGSAAAAFSAHGGLASSREGESRGGASRAGIGVPRGGEAIGIGGSCFSAVTEVLLGGEGTPDGDAWVVADPLEVGREGARAV